MKNNDIICNKHIPEDVAWLMTELAFAPAADKITDGKYSIYDGTCGSGELISAADQKLRTLTEKSGRTISAHIYGQEQNPELYALCKAAFLPNEENINISFGSALSDDSNAESKFDFMISCPPRGKSWKADYDKMSVRGRIVDERFIDNTETVKPQSMIPGKRDGQLLYLLNNISKMKDSPLGSRIVEVHSGSLLFSGKAGSAESNARRYLIKRDLIEAIIALPKNLFHGTADPLFILVLSNRKEERRKGKIQLINASAMKATLTKNAGRKNCVLDEKFRAEIMRIFSDMEESEVSRIVDSREFGYWSMVVDRPLRQRVEVNAATIKDTLSMFKTFGVDTDHENDDIPEVGLVDLFSFTKNNPKVRTVKTPKTWGEVQFEQVYNIYMKILIDMMSEEPYMDYNAFLERFNAHPLHKNNPTKFSDFEDFMFPLLTKDPAAAVVMRNGKPVPDDELRVVMTVPFTYEGGIDGFIKNEILPDEPDAMAYPESAITGCEINFSKYFCKPRRLRGSAEIIEELKRLESEIAELKNSSAAEAILRHAEKTHMAYSAYRSIALENAASEQLIGNTGFAERNVLAFVDGRIVRKNVDLSDDELPAAYENYRIVFPGNIILRLTEFRGGQTELRTALVTEQGIISSSYLCLKAADNILPEYLFLQLRAADISGEFLELGGEFRRNLKFKDIAKMPIRLVPLEEQKAVIESAREKNAPITAAIDKLYSVVSDLKEFENSLFAEALKYL